MIASAVFSFPIYGSRGFIMREYIGGDLLSYCNTHEALPEPHVRTIAGRIAHALFAMHQRRWAHLDVKLENVLLDDAEPTPNSYLADFGLARPITAEPFVGACGTPEYCAPELVARRPFDEAVDMWALGVMIFMMATGSPPFPSAIEEEYEFTEAVLAGEYAEEMLDDVAASEDCRDVIVKLLRVNSAERMTATQAIAHPFFAAAEAAAVKRVASRFDTADAEFTDRVQAT
jgi:serine/threonine protein kinase